MKFIRQFGIVLIFCFIGEVLKQLLPLPIPASIYGLLLLFIGLERKLIRLDQVKDVSSLLIEIMPMMFIPTAVGLLESWSELQAICIQVLLIIILSTAIVMGVSGRMTQFMIQMEKRKKSERDTM